ncbi:MAG TPA: transcription-repair coupling factor, partial [Kofleriaceae bacterium]|nr:transcription-repair coupling factor [Kofleriaceae bacterium]
SARPPRVIVASIEALTRRAMDPQELAQRSLVIRRGGDLDLADLSRRLDGAGFARASLCDVPGTFAVRGGVIDIYSPLCDDPARIELFGDTIDTLRTFDPETQRTTGDLSTLLICPAKDTLITDPDGLRARILEAADRAAQPSAITRQLLEDLASGADILGRGALTPAFHRALCPVWHHFPDRATWLVVDPDAIRRAITDHAAGVDTAYHHRLDDHRIAFPPAAFFATADELSTLFRHTPRIDIRAVHEDGIRHSITGEVTSHRELTFALSRKKHVHDETSLLQPLAGALADWQTEGYRVAIAEPSEGRTKRLVGLLSALGIDLHIAERPVIDPSSITAGGPPVLVPASLSAGFAEPAEKLAILTGDDIFGIHRETPKPKKSRTRAETRRALLGTDDFSTLEPGTYLVHQLHGIGRYCGISRLRIAASARTADSTAEPPPMIDFLNIEYAGGRLYLPVFRLGEVERYIGTGKAPRLDTLGGQTWDAARKKTSERVLALAEEMLQVYAHRRATPGHAFPAADAAFADFEAGFGLEETPDQQRAIDEVLADMQAPRPMDRLVCGDVGYGKTEVALRAIFKATFAGGKQAAFLAPTTVLVEQHYQTISERLAGWPVNVAKLSRFSSKKEQLEAIRGIAAGTIDAVVGTHRLLSADVRFKDLGLVIIDEEQRFGVAHKERLKRMRSEVDVLALSATPIPRTLNLALTGLRDLSLITTPPSGRQAIRTLVARPDPGVIKRGIHDELARGGQVFFVVPRIAEHKTGRRHHVADRSLYEWADHIAELCPEAHVGIAHGQMSERELEKTMVAFISGKLDVLVSTTIIESGLDIPRANTMFIARADRLGLGQLYQLRGRIGRAHHFARCYLLVPPLDKLSRTANRRLAALSRLQALGSGFHIATHDLEIRGGGELFGARQSGAIAQVGFETFAAMLEDAIARLSDENHAPTRARDPELITRAPGFIPDDYVPDPGIRLGLYKRLGTAGDDAEIAAVAEEIRDRFGELPEPTERLCQLMGIKLLARFARADSIELSPQKVTLALAADTPLAADKVAALVRARGSRWRLSPDMRLIGRLDGGAGGAIAQARAALLELSACVS